MTFIHTSNKCTTELIDQAVDVRDAYGLSHLSRRGVTAHVKVMQVSHDVNKAVHRWEKELNSRSGFPRLDMIDLYNTLESLVSVILRYCWAL
jgi:hypothetical protein